MDYLEMCLLYAFTTLRYLKTVKTSSLTILNLINSDNGDFTCKILGECNEVTSESVNLTVYKQITITSQPRSTTICEETSISFALEATGDNLTYQWTKDGVEICGASSNSYIINSVTTNQSGENKYNQYRKKD